LNFVSIFPHSIIKKDFHPYAGPIIAQTALVKITKDLLLISILVLLDHSAAFDATIKYS